jgi:undecaprenyl-diphosphatase
MCCAIAACLSLFSAGQAAILGIVQGITEYLPVSSAAHLILMEKWMLPKLSHETSQVLAAYNIFLQGGSVLAILILYRRRIGEIFNGLLGRSPAGLRLFSNLVVAFIPAIALGFFLDNCLQRQGQNFRAIASALALGGFYIFVVKYFYKPRRCLAQLRWQQSLFIGLLQCVALFPGVSRSLMTISGGLWLGLPFGEAMEFSFLLGAGTLCAATIYKFFGYACLPMGLPWDVFFCGFACALLTSLIVIGFFIRHLHIRTLVFFAYYRFLLAAFIFTHHWL